VRIFFYIVCVSLSSLVIPNTVHRKLIYVVFSLPPALFLTNKSPLVTIHTTFFIIRTSDFPQCIHGNRTILRINRDYFLKQQLAGPLNGAQVIFCEAETEFLYVILLFIRAFCFEVKYLGLGDKSILSFVITYSCFACWHFLLNWFILCLLKLFGPRLYAKRTSCRLFAFICFGHCCPSHY
jgi:hypothetical protein